MNPQLLHQIADDRVIQRRRSFAARSHAVRRSPRGARVFTAKLRAGVGGLLITVGTHVAGARSVPVELGRPST
jgi:hypothetical protein